MPITAVLMGWLFGTARQRRERCLVQWKNIAPLPSNH